MEWAGDGLTSVPQLVLLAGVTRNNREKGVGEESQHPLNKKP